MTNWIGFGCAVVIVGLIWGMAWWKSRRFRTPPRLPPKDTCPYCIAGHPFKSQVGTERYHIVPAAADEPNAWTYEHCRAKDVTYDDTVDVTLKAVDRWKTRP